MGDLVARQVEVEEVTQAGEFISSDFVELVISKFKAPQFDVFGESFNLSDVVSIEIEDIYVEAQPFFKCWDGRQIRFRAIGDPVYPERKGN